MVQIGHHNIYSPTFISTFLDKTLANSSSLNKVLQIKVTSLNNSLPSISEKHLPKTYGPVVWAIITAITFIVLAWGYKKYSAHGYSYLNGTKQEKNQDTNRS